MIHKVFKSDIFKSIILSSFKRSFQPINLFVGVVLGYISPKAFPKECCYYGAYQWSKFSPILLVKEVFISLVLSIILIVSVGGRSSPHNFEMFAISPQQACSFRCWFSNNSVITFLEGCFPSLVVAEVGIFFSILLFQWSIFYSFFPRHCDVALFTHHLELWGSCSFLAYPFNRSAFNVFWSYQVLHLVSTGVLFEFVLPCSLFISFQPEWFQFLLMHCVHHS